MAEETLKIIVEQEGRGTAIRDAKRDAEQLKQEASQLRGMGQKWGAQEEAAFPQTVAQIKKLQRAASAYDEKGDEGAARSARADSRVLERELSQAAAQRHRAEREAAQSARNETKEKAREEARATREQQKRDQQVMREHRERSAIAKAQQAEEEARLSRLGRAAGGVALSQAGGAGFGGLSSALSGLGGPVAAVAAVAASVVAGVFKSETDRARSRELIRLGGEADRVGDQNRLRRLGSFEGSAGANREEMRNAFDEARERGARSTQLAAAAKPKWYQWEYWFLGKDANTSEGEEDILKNNDAIRRANERAMKAREQMKQKWDEEGSLEMQAQEKRLDYDPRAARDLEHQVLWRREYNRLMKETEDTTVSAHGADMRVAEAQRTENARFGRLVNARSGARDIARAAGFASGEYDRSNRPVVTAIDGLTSTVKQGQGQRPHITDRPRR